MFSPLRHYADFSGRATRKEFWLFVLFQFLALCPIWTFFIIFINAARIPHYDADVLAACLAVFSGLFALAMLIPNLAVMVRRFHDQGRSGALMILGLIPCVGGIVLFIFMLLGSQPHDNEFGPY